jgi:hypothetical protein
MGTASGSVMRLQLAGSTFDDPPDMADCLHAHLFACGRVGRMPMFHAINLLVSNADHQTSDIINIVFQHQCFRLKGAETCPIHRRWNLCSWLRRKQRRKRRNRHSLLSSRPVL